MPRVELHPLSGRAEILEYVEEQLEQCVHELAHCSPTSSTVGAINALYAAVSALHRLEKERGHLHAV